MGVRRVSPGFRIRSPPTGTSRSRAKSDRRDKLIAAAERLVAERGFLAVRLEDIGAAAGVSGPAIYRHFPNKEALLVELLVGISTRLLAGARAVVADAADDRDRAGRTDRFPPRLRARRVGSDPHPGPRPGISARRRRSVRSARPSGSTSRSGSTFCVRLNRATRRGRRAADGARGLRPVEFDAAQRPARHSQIGRPRNSFRLAGHLAGDDDRGPVLGRPNRRLGAS